MGFVSNGTNEKIISHFLHKCHFMGDIGGASNPFFLYFTNFNFQKMHAQFAIRFFRDFGIRVFEMLRITRTKYVKR